jgi:ElaB/YqjD/DUF883 family membrane-anchored ribosome-binding protein
MESKTSRIAEKAENNANRVNDDLENIKSSFNQLREDVAGLLGQAFGLGKHGAGAAREAGVDAMEALKDRLGDLKGQGMKRVETFERKIEDNPLPAALIAFGIGFVIAKVLSRR